VARVPLTPADYLPHLEKAAADVAAVLETGDLDAPVHACVPWRLTDLAHHLGGVHRWARAAVVGDPLDPAPADAPIERTAQVAWFREGADTLLATLRDTDPDTPCWTHVPPHTAAFWFRRQAHETAVHAGDAAASQGTDHHYGATLALDGIDEVVGSFFPRGVRIGRTPPLTHALAIAPSEGGRWVLAGDGGTPPDAADATVSGSAEALLLLLWHRTTLDDARLTVTGDRRAADAVLAAALTP
jgi:uncharacterized protein (TIGR03083 family)